MGGRAPPANAADPRREGERGDLSQGEGFSAWEVPESTWETRARACTVPKATYCKQRKSAHVLRSTLVPHPLVAAILKPLPSSFCTAPDDPHRPWQHPAPRHSVDFHGHHCGHCGTVTATVALPWPPWHRCGHHSTVAATMAPSRPPRHRRSPAGRQLLPPAPASRPSCRGGPMGLMEHSEPRLTQHQE